MKKLSYLSGSSAHRHLSKDKIMKSLILKTGPYELKLSKNYFRSLVRAITGQQLSTKAAETIWERVKTLLKNKITPETILKTPDIRIRKCGLSRPKIKYIKDLAIKVKTKAIVFSKIVRLDTESAIQQLTAVKGIGRWTAEMFVMFSIGHEDVFSKGDAGLLRAIRVFYGEKFLIEKNLDKLTQTWSPYRTAACLYLWAALDSK